MAGAEVVNQGKQATPLSKEAKAMLEIIKRADPKVAKELEAKFQRDPSQVKKYLEKFRKERDAAVDRAVERGTKKIVKDQMGATEKEEQPKESKAPEPKKPSPSKPVENKSVESKPAQQQWRGPGVVKDKYGRITKFQRKGSTKVISLTYSSKTSTQPSFVSIHDTSNGVVREFKRKGNSSWQYTMKKDGKITASVSWKGDIRITSSGEYACRNAGKSWQVYSQTGQMVKRRSIKQQVIKQPYVKPAPPKKPQTAPSRYNNQHNDNQAMFPRVRKFIENRPRPIARIFGRR